MTVIRRGPLPLVPEVVYVRGLFSADECDGLVAKGRAMPAKQATKLYGDGRSEIDLNWRNCQYRAPGNQHFPEVTKKLKQITDWEQFEEFSLQNYPERGYVNNHVDWSSGLKNPRLATLLVYLNDDFDGGGTVFPKLQLEFKPVKGDAVFFNYVPGQTTSSLHRGQKVLNGEKWIITCWFIERS
jgi:prolyl 4-hydroxylase